MATKIKFPFSDSELIGLLEVARIALSDADTFDDAALLMDLTDEEMSLLLTRVQQFMEEDKK
jgi:hypothetical protein